MLKRKEFKNEDLFEQYLEKRLYECKIIGENDVEEIWYHEEKIYPSDDPELQLLQREIETHDYLYLVARKIWLLLKLY